MVAKLTSDPMRPNLSTPWIEHAPSPTATVEGATHLVRDVNAAFRRLVDRSWDDIVGKPFCELLP